MEDIIILTDEEGNETKFELVENFSMGGRQYSALMELGEPALIYIVKEEIVENDEAVVVTVEGDELEQAIKVFENILKDSEE